MDAAEFPGAVVVPAACPAWCVTEHGLVLGEEDSLHIGARHIVHGDVAAWLCMSTDADGVVDGPYVVVGDTEYTLDEARALGVSLIALTEGAGSRAAAKG
ncbi:hypothetical protein [Naasia sp. SYSU D00057]|uniref:hypothetical protein n=1 Tax=Naasia sp. SYSU D00057 TaxID=2817380 RepID=UPI001B309A90|nr:hypothetical protein [Naasia sp. SYSU D00057]